LTFDIKDSIYSIYTYMNVSMKQAILHKILPIMAGALFLSACGKEAAQSAQSAPSRAMEVEVIPVKLESLAWKETYPARVEGMRRAEVRPRVSGIIVKRLYEEGSFVEEGAVLFQIDPVPYELAAKRPRLNSPAPPHRHGRPPATATASPGSSKPAPSARSSVTMPFPRSNLPRQASCPLRLRCVRRS
jgi:hypothetical protein